MRNVTPTESELFGVPSQFRHLVQVTDCKALDAAKSVNLVSVRTRNGYRKDWEQEMIKRDQTLLEVPEKLLALQEGPSPLDVFDSGIVYLVQPGAEPGTFQARIVSRTDDYPHKKRLQATLVRPYFEMHKELDHQVRQWVEGAIIRVFTVLVPIPGTNPEQYELDVDGVPKVLVFISSRNKIECSTSQWINVPECPFVNDAFMEAAALQGIKMSDFNKPWRCYAFVLRHHWNQIRDRSLKQPELILFKTFSCEGGTYVEIPLAETGMEIHGTKVLPTLSCAEAAKIVLEEGAVIITTKPFNNMQITMEATAEEYDWLTSKSKNPIITYCELRSSSPHDCARYEAILFGWAKDKVEAFKKDYPNILLRTSNFLQKRALLQFDNPKALANLETDRTIEGIMRAVRRDHMEAKQRHIGRNRFMWGGTRPKFEAKVLESVMKALQKLEKQNGASLAILIGKCTKLAASEIVRSKKLTTSMNGSGRTSPPERKSKKGRKPKATSQGGMPSPSITPPPLAAVTSSQVANIEPSVETGLRPITRSSSPAFSSAESSPRNRSVSPALDEIRLATPSVEEDLQDVEFVPRQDWSTDDEEWSKSWASQSDSEMKIE